MVDQGDPGLGRIEPGRHLVVSHQIDVPHPGGELLDRPQGVAQLSVVLKPDVRGPRVGLDPRRSQCLPLALLPHRLGPVDPGVDDVDREPDIEDFRVGQGGERTHARGRTGIGGRCRSVLQIHRTAVHPPHQGGASVAGRRLEAAVLVLGPALDQAGVLLAVDRARLRRRVRAVEAEDVGSPLAVHGVLKDRTRHEVGHPGRVPVQILGPDAGVHRMREPVVGQQGDEGIPVRRGDAEAVSPRIGLGHGEVVEVVLLAEAYDEVPVSLDRLSGGDAGLAGDLAQHAVEPAQLHARRIPAGSPRLVDPALHPIHHTAGEGRATAGHHRQQGGRDDREEGRVVDRVSRTGRPDREERRARFRPQCTGQLSDLAQGVPLWAGGDVGPESDSSVSQPANLPRKVPPPWDPAAFLWRVAHHLGRCVVIKDNGRDCTRSVRARPDQPNGYDPRATRCLGVEEDDCERRQPAERAREPDSTHRRAARWQAVGSHPAAAHGDEADDGGEAAVRDPSARRQEPCRPPAAPRDELEPERVRSERLGSERGHPFWTTDRQAGRPPTGSPPAAAPRPAGYSS